MAFVIRPGRNPIVRAAFEGLEADERRAKKIAKVYRAKDLSALPAAKSKKTDAGIPISEPTPKPRRSSRGKTKKAKG